MSNLLDKASIVTTPTSYDNGKILSVKPAPSLGSELIVNGDFATDSDWNKQTSNWTIVNGYAVCDGLQTSNSSLFQDLAVVNGKSHRIDFTITNSVNNLNLILGATTIGQYGSGTHSIYVTKDANASARIFFQATASNNFSGSIDNVSVKQVIDGDFDFTRNSSATRVNSQGLIEDVQILSSNLVTNGDFSNGSTGWTLTGLTNVVNNAVSFVDNGTNANSIITQSNIVTANKQYKLTFDVNRYVLGQIQVILGSASSVTNQLSQGVGTYTMYLLSGSSTNLQIKRNGAVSNFDFDITNIKLIEISSDTNLPRIDYTGGDGHWLFEPQSTNLFLNSETLSTQGVSTNAASYTVSFYGTGSITFSGTHTGTLNGTGVSDRVSLTFTASSGTLTSTVSDSVTKAQLEQNSFATSYIPTNGEANGVTRLADAASGAGSSDLINSTEGVLYAEIAALANENVQRISSISDGTSNNTIQLGFLNNSTNYKFFASVRVGGSFQAFMTYDFGAVQPTFKKCAVKYKQNDFALWIDGVEVATDTSGNVPTGLNKLSFDRGDGGQDFYGKTKCVAVFKEALTDAELTCLTTI